MYISLHNHSDGSLLDGYQTVQEMVSRAKALGMSAISLTDHGTMRNIIRFYEECTRNDIKPIVGCEFYFCPDVNIRDMSLTHHLVLLAMNDEGYMNLKQLDTFAYNRNSWLYKPRIDWNALQKYNKGLICLSACMASIVNTENGEEWFKRYKELFHGRFYAEIQPLNMEKQWAYNEKVIGLARKYNVPLVVTTDAHYSVPEGRVYHSHWIRINDHQYHNDENYIWSEDEIRKTQWIPQNVIDECIESSQHIAERCNVIIPDSGSHYPKYPCSNPKEKVREICRSHWKKLVPKGKYKEYAERFEMEMKDLEATNYLEYLLIIWSVLEWCRNQNIPTGEGRGSSAGCLVGYLMGIHKIDPIKYHTEFFRFCNRERRSPADVDSDLSTLNRGRVIEHVREMYGNVCKVQTLGYTKDPDKPSAGKEAVLKAWQALYNKYSGDAPMVPCEEQGGSMISPSWEYNPKYKIEASKYVVESIDDLQDAPISLNEKQKAELIDVAKHFCGRIDKIGVHASAVLVTPDDLVNYTPVEGCFSNDTSTGKRVYLRTACYSFHELEQRGNLKLDLLGLNTLDLIDKCIGYIGKDMNLDDIPMDDKQAYDMYSNGNLDGVFQMESPGMRKVAKELHVSCFDDVAALVALYRPGPLDSGMMQQYIDGKNGASVDYLCDAYKEITKNTFGVIVYQEQCMKLAMKMAGYSLGEADMLRKVIGRKEMTKIDTAVKEFISRCMEHGYSKEIAEKVGMQIKAAGRYLFNKCLSGREYIFRHATGKWMPSIGEMYKIRNDKEYARQTGHRSLHDKYTRDGYGYAYSFNGKSIVKNTIVDIRESGVMPVFILETESGKQVRCTLNHKIPTPSGTKILAELSVGDSVYTDGGYDSSIDDYLFYHKRQVMNAQKGHCGFTHRPNGESVKFDNYRVFMRGMMARCQKCGKPYKQGSKFEVHHIDHNRENNDNSNLIWLCNSCHKKAHYKDGRTEWGTKGRVVQTEKIVSITYECDEMCYDVEMDNPYHNFVTGNGVVVCNSHSVAYGRLSYKTAYLKAHYPAQFMCALLNTKNDNQEKVIPYLANCKEMDIKILPPDFSVGNKEWQIEANAVRVGLTYIKGVGKELTLSIQEETNCDYCSLTDWNRIVEYNNSDVVKGLIQAGALDFLGKSRGWMMSNLSNTKKYVKRLQQCKERIGFYRDEYEKATNDKERARALRMEKQWAEKRKGVTFVECKEGHYDKAAGEIATLGFSFSKVPDVLCGVASSVHEITTKNGNKMALVTFKTEDYGTYKGSIAPFLWGHGKTRHGRNKLFVEQGKAYEFMMKKNGQYTDIVDVKEVC